jgi:outer membrane protein OmpA-like peptidoglycan-associated protein
VSGNTSTATLSTTGAAPGTITVTCNVVDDKGQSASSTSTVTVVAPTPPPAPTTSALCSINFERDKKRPARVDNEAKACLDDIALNLQRSSDAKLAIVGNASSSEKTGSKLAAARAVNTKAYLVSEKGVDASRISVYTGSQDSKTAASTLIPTGATLDSTGLTAVDESAVKVQPRTKTHRKRK